MNKCGGCGKFVAASGEPVCIKCKIIYHNKSVSCSGTSVTLKSWVCPCCIAKMPRQDNTNTPIKSTVEYNCISPPEINNTIIDNSASCEAQIIPHSLELLNEIKILRTEIGSLRNEISRFREELNDVRVEINLHKIRVVVLSGEVEKVSNRIDGVEKQNKQITKLESTIDQLKTDLNRKDQELFSNDLEVTGVPEKDGENVNQIVQLIATKISIKLEEYDTVDTYRSDPDV